MVASKMLAAAWQASAMNLTSSVHRTAVVGQTNHIIMPARLIKRQTRRVKLASASRVVIAAVAPSAPFLQLATARLPADVNKTAFVQQLYQWAATLTTNGRNLPFALPLRADPLPDGFQISLLRVTSGGVLAVADVVAEVESVAGAGDVLIVRLYEGEAAEELGLAGTAPQPEQRLKTLLQACVDIPLIMQTMPNAIKRAAMVSR